MDENSGQQKSVILLKGCRRDTGGPAMKPLLYRDDLALGAESGDRSSSINHCGV